LQALKDENIRITQHEAEQHPEIFSRYVGVPNGVAKAMSVIDASREAAVLRAFDSGPHTSNEYDGVVFYLEADCDVAAHVLRINRLIHPLKARVKQPKSPLELAKQKYTDLDWRHVNPMPFGEFLLAYTQCRKALARPSAAREIDSVFSDVVRGRQHWVVTQGVSGYDVWDASRHLWLANACGKDLADQVRNELRETFGHRTTDVEGNVVWVEPAAPCESDAFCTKVAECLPRYMPKMEYVPLDHHTNTEGRLLFADGKLFDYNAMTCRFSEPEDRLSRRCAVPLPSWTPSAAVLADAEKLAAALVSFYELGGKSIEYVRHEGTLAEAVDGQDAPELRALRDTVKSAMQLLTSSGECPWLKGVYNAFEDYDEAFYVVRICTRVLSGISGFAEAYALTGPPSSSKSWLVLPLLRLLGQGPAHLAQPLPSGYFTTAPRSDGDGSRPVTAQLAGCKLCIPKEVPVKPIVGEALKSILDPRDVAVSARANHSGRQDDGSFTVTWTIVLVSQGAISQDSKDMDCGVLDKVVELRPPFEFVAEPDSGNPRQRAADHVLADAADAGELSAEMFWWTQRLFSTVTRNICHGRNMVPVPPSCAQIRGEKRGDHTVQRVVDWMEDHLESCADNDATSIPQLHERLAADLGKVEPSCRSAAGLGPRRYQCRAGPKEAHFAFYKCSLGGGALRAVRIKTSAAASSSLA